MAKSNTSSYVVTYELAFDNDNPSSVLDKLEKIAKAIYNDCLNECLKRYHKLIHDKKYQELLKDVLLLKKQVKQNVFQLMAKLQSLQKKFLWVI